MKREWEGFWLSAKNSELEGGQTVHVTAVRVLFFYYAAVKKFLKISINVCYSQWLAGQANKMLIKLTDARYILQLQLKLVFVVTSMCLYTSSVYINQSWRQEL